MTGVSTEPLADVAAFPFIRTDPFAPAADYAGVDQHGAPERVNFKGFAPAWLVTGYDEVRAVLNSPNTSVQNIPDPTRGGDGSEEGLMPGFFLAMDAPQHTKLRRVLAKEFTPRHIKTLRPVIERIADRLIDDVLASEQPVDLVEKLALPLPSLVICELLGVPYDKHEWFQEETVKVLASDSTMEDVQNAIIAVMTYLVGLTVEKVENPSDDLISMLATHVRSGELEAVEVGGMATLLLMAGHETTGNMLSLGVYTLLEHPEQRALLDADPSLWPQAVEELLRYLNIIGNLPRVLTEPLEVNGTVIDAGDLVMVALDAGDRDPKSADSDPNVFDIRRESKGHLAFGHGIHTCMGAPLARLELQIVLRKLLERIPTLRLAVPADEIAVKSDAKIFGLYELPVAW
ncbi:cytochrome P450 [Microbacterium gorillae]|uniref:cytochrome P450 n=1 Tax=Microbacterium gorillae TaxID=1231063 RepID=UPI00058C2281|nr:cytochrome P450 [Microbacterium gorillae]